MRRGLAPWLLLSLLAGPGAAEGEGFAELRRYSAPAARQGVAVDAEHFYAIGNRRIEKYDRRTGEKRREWVSPEDGPIVHLNAGIVLDGVIHCAHSNFPDVPMWSSIERFDAETLAHLGSQSFGIAEGSATWVDRREGAWWVAFANYRGRGGVPGRDPAWTSLVKFDDRWRRVAGFVYPPEVIERFGRYSNSGGAWGADGLLYITGHDAEEVYALRLPSAGSVLELAEILPVPFPGQGIAFDPSDPEVLWGIVKSRREVVAARRGAAR